MATKKAAGSSKNLKDSQPKYLGVKLYGGERALAGAIIVRQRGSKIMPGDNVKMGKDHTLYAVANGIVTFGTKRKIQIDNTIKVKKIVHVK